MDRFQIPGVPTCRVVYPQGLFEKLEIRGVEGEPKYNAIILIPKSDEAKVKRVMEEYNKAFVELQAKGFKGKTVKAIERKQNCLEDGDEYADSKEGCEQFRGYLRLKVASRNYRPLVTDLKKKAILNGCMINGLDVEQISDEQLADGDYIFANVSFWSYNNTSYSGIGANVHAVMRAKKGEQLCGASTNVEDYIDTEDYE